MQKGPLRFREIIDNRCVSFIHSAFSYIVFIWSHSSITSTCLLVSVCIWVLGLLQTRGSWSTHELPLVLLSKLWLSYCAIIFFVWYNRWVTCYGRKTCNDFLIGKWIWILYVTKGLFRSWYIVCICSETFITFNWKA